MLKRSVGCRHREMQGSTPWKHGCWFRCPRAVSISSGVMLVGTSTLMCWVRKGCFRQAHRAQLQAHAWSCCRVEGFSLCYSLKEGSPPSYICPAIETGGMEVTSNLSCSQVCNAKLLPLRGSWDRRQSAGEAEGSPQQQLVIGSTHHRALHFVRLLSALPLASRRRFMVAVNINPKPELFHSHPLPRYSHPQLLSPKGSSSLVSGCRVTELLENQARPLQQRAKSSFFP